MPKKIFKAGNYGKKGSYSVEQLKNWIGKEFSITAGHVGDWKKEGYPTTAIPVAGVCKATDVDEQGYLIGEFTYNEFGEKIKEKYPNLSIGISASGVPNHIALLGYAPPHIKDLDKSFSEFSVDLTQLEETEQVIEFEEGEEKKTAQELINEFLEAIEGLDFTGVDTNALENKVWNITDTACKIKRLQELGYDVKKQEQEFAGMTPEEIKEVVKAEFTREQEEKEVKEKVLSKVPPVLKGIMEFAIERAFDKNEYSNVIEFSETDKAPMAEKLKEFAKTGTPFDNLFKTLVKEEDVKEKVETPQEKAKRIANLF